MQLLTYTLLQLIPLIATVQGLAINSRDQQVPLSRPLIDVGYAKYRGVRLEGGVDEFLGMRYARPPLGNLRFRAPREPSHELLVKDASKFGPVCMNVSEKAGPGVSEDCLFVNVFKPSQANESSNLPVWVYIQGGGYAANASPNYNGTEVIQQSDHGLVFVNFNYRVGALGFLASEHVRQDGDLNAGLLDQRLFLHWVQRNIRQFGGNPDHVIIHGASAGGGSVSYHLTAYAGKKDNQLFVGAIPQNPFWPTQRTLPEMEFQYTRLLNDTKCSSLDCLRAMDVESFLAASPRQPLPGAASSDPLPLWYWLPVVDGDLVVDHMYNLFNTGRFIRVPVLVGDDTDEGTGFAVNASTAQEVTTFMKNNYPHLSESQLHSIIKAYPKGQEEPTRAAYFSSAAAAYGDATFTCAGNEIAASVARFFDPRRIWNYRYNVLDPENTAAGIGVPHTFESTAIFGVGNAGGAAASYSTINAEIIPITMKYFISFVLKLNPNELKDQSAPNWDPWGQGTGERLKLQTNATAMEPVPATLSGRCSLWRALARTTEV